MHRLASCGAPVARRVSAVCVQGSRRMKTGGRGARNDDFSNLLRAKDERERASLTQQETPSVSLEDYVRTVKILGVIEDIVIDKETYFMSGSNNPLWRHYYTVNGQTAVNYISKEWLKDRAELGMNEGTRVAMSCKVKPDGTLILSKIRPANASELKEINAKDHESVERTQQKKRELLLRKRIIECVCHSKVSANLDLEGFKRTSESVYRFVKDDRRASHA